MHLPLKSRDSQQPLIEDIKRWMANHFLPSILNNEKTGVIIFGPSETRQSNLDISYKSHSKQMNKS